MRKQSSHLHGDFSRLRLDGIRTCNPLFPCRAFNGIHKLPLGRRGRCSFGVKYKSRFVAGLSHRLYLGRLAAGSPLLAGLCALLLSFGAMEIRTLYSGRSLASLVSYLKAAAALTVMPHSVVFA